jgi:hypothetical protein
MFDTVPIFSTHFADAYRCMEVSATADKYVELNTDWPHKKPTCSTEIQSTLILFSFLLPLLDIFFILSVSISILKIVYRQMVESLMNGELETTWKKTALA